MDNIIDSFPEFCLMDFMTILSSQDREKKILDLTAAFTEVGCPEDVAKSVAAYVTINNAIKECRKLWAKIPTYKQAKAAGTSENACDHFDQHWRVFKDAGLLFQHLLSDYDAALITDLNGFLRRHSDIDASNYRIAPLKEYNNMLAQYFDNDFCDEVLRVSRVLYGRKIKNGAPATKADG